MKSKNGGIIFTDSGYRFTFIKEVQYQIWLLKRRITQLNQKSP
jgi:hypothetical protein